MSRPPVIWRDPVEDGAIDRAPGDSVVALYTQSATGKISGAPVVQDYAVIYNLADDQLGRMRGYLGRAQALEAAGLSE